MHRMQLDWPLSAYIMGALCMLLNMHIIVVVVIRCKWTGEVEELVMSCVLRTAKSFYLKYADPLTSLELLNM